MAATNWKKEECELPRTKRLPCSTMKKGGFMVMHKDHPCKIIDISLSKPGKHGSSKGHYVGMDIFTGKRYDEIHPTHSRVLVPEVSHVDMEVSFMDDAGIICFDENMEPHRLPLTKGCTTPVEDIKTMLAESESGTKRIAMATIWRAIGCDVIKSVRLVNAE